jgi:hypothetical protein
MSRSFLLAGTLVLAISTIPPSLVQGQATRTWVSDLGDDANPCTRTAPCKTFTGTISKTTSGGEINCLGSTTHQTITITNALVIDCNTIIGSNGIAISLSPFDKVAFAATELGYTVVFTPGEFGTVNAVYVKQGKSTELHGLLRERWEERETINVRYLPTSDGVRPTGVNRAIEQKPPIGFWKLVSEDTRAPPGLIVSTEHIENPPELPEKK